MKNLVKQPIVCWFHKMHPTVHVPGMRCGCGFKLVNKKKFRPIPKIMFGGNSNQGTVGV